MGTDLHRRPFEILLVEDNPADVRLMREALTEGRTRKHIRVAEDGVEAMRVLTGPSAPPDLILLDLNLPRKNGHEVLLEIRHSDRLRLIPVIVFSSSSSEEDVRAAYSRQANCYVAKPGDLESFFLALHRIEAFWLDTARLPSPA